MGDVQTRHARDSLDSIDFSSRRSNTSIVPTSVSYDSESTADHIPSRASLPILSPTSTLLSGSNPRSPLKRSIPDDTFGTSQQKRIDQWQANAYDLSRPLYRIYEPAQATNPYDLSLNPFATASNNVPKIVEAEYRRLADSAAATIPEDKLLTPAIWKQQFCWPNQYTTTQCACLMRYFIEKLAPWVRGHFLSDHSFTDLFRV